MVTGRTKLRIQVRQDIGLLLNMFFTDFQHTIIFCLLYDFGYPTGTEIVTVYNNCDLLTHFIDKV